MSSRKTRALIAQETLVLLAQGHYSLPDGSTVFLKEEQQRAVENTREYNPSQLNKLYASLLPPENPQSTEFRVENCTTFAAARALAESDPEADVLCLNFASAKNPGGGFLNGSQAQEESLARASGLYPCINPMRTYYETNKQCGTSLYTHHMIHSPLVPVFREDKDELIEKPYFTSILTAPAVNAGAVRNNESHHVWRIPEVMDERTAYVLAVARAHGHDTLVLGAWGCGVFRNDPEEVAELFRRHLTENDRFRGAFRRVVFAVLDRSKGLETIEPFHNKFSGI